MARLCRGTAQVKSREAWSCFREHEQKRGGHGHALVSTGRKEEGTIVLIRMGWSCQISGKISILLKGLGGKFLGFDNLSF